MRRLDWTADGGRWEAAGRPLIERDGSGHEFVLSACICSEHREVTERRSCGDDIGLELDVVAAPGVGLCGQPEHGLNSAHHVELRGRVGRRARRPAAVAPSPGPQHSRLLPLLCRQRLPDLDADLGDLPAGLPRDEPDPGCHDRVDLLDHGGSRRSTDRRSRRSLGTPGLPRVCWRDLLPRFSRVRLQLELCHPAHRLRHRGPGHDALLRRRTRPPL